MKRRRECRRDSHRAPLGVRCEETHSMPKAKSKKSEVRDQDIKPGASSETPAPVAIAAVRLKVGEGRDNLVRRGKWFSSRSGQKG